MADTRQTKEMLKGLLAEVVGSDASVDAIDYSLTPKPGIVASGLFVSLFRDPGDGPNTPPGAGVYRFQITDDNAVEYRPFVAERDIEFGEYSDGGSYYDYTPALPAEYQEAVDELDQTRRDLEEQLERQQRRAHRKEVENLIERRQAEGRLPKGLQREVSVSFAEGDRHNLTLETFLMSLEEDQLAFFSEWSGKLPTTEGLHPNLFSGELTSADYSEIGRDPIAMARAQADQNYNTGWMRGDDY